MRRVRQGADLPSELVLGTRLTERVPAADQKRQRTEVQEILRRLAKQPGVILADEVGMGKTFVALGVAYSESVRNPSGPVVVMVPPNLVDKWEQDLKTFCELYLDGRTPRAVETGTSRQLRQPSVLRYGVARHSLDLMKLLDDEPKERAQVIFLAQGAMTRRHGDKWIRLALIAEALRLHGRGKAHRLIRVKEQIHRFLAELLWAIGEAKDHERGDKLWQDLLRSDVSAWRDIYNRSASADRWLKDAPVPKSVARALRHLDLKELAEALKQMPVRAVGGSERVTERIKVARKALNDVEKHLWTELLTRARWRSPLLVMDEAHHLKNPQTSLARQLQSAESASDLKTGDGAMAGAFDRMLFLTATPFQLGHHELVQVLRRFGDIRWDTAQLGPREEFQRRLDQLHQELTESQRNAIALQRSWSRLRPEDVEGDGDAWWAKLMASPKRNLSTHQRAVVEAYEAAKDSRTRAEEALRPWVVRHNKGATWAGTSIVRRERVDGAAICEGAAGTGLLIPPSQLLPFFLAARSAVRADQEVLSEALCSSYEAFRQTRQGQLAKDDEDGAAPVSVDLSHAGWYLAEFDRALTNAPRDCHPKISETVRKVVDLWEAGEKVLVFAFYRYTCRALRIHISDEIQRRVLSGTSKEDMDRAQKRFFDDIKSPGRRALDTSLERVVGSRGVVLLEAGVTPEQSVEAVDVMRRFLRVHTTLARCFPFAEADEMDPPSVVERMLSKPDGSGVTWREKFETFLEFLARCSTGERAQYLDAALRTETGSIRVEEDAESELVRASTTQTLANVQVATGTTKRETRARLMRSFNTPFFPDILVCSEVMGEGVDLQRFCRHVIHHDLAWNPSTIEQRTGRIDRLGCKAEGKNPIVVYLPYLAGTADERQYQVMSHREQWFRVVMGQDEVARLITAEATDAVPLPASVSSELGFKLELAPSHAS